MNDAPSWAKELLQQVQQISASQQALQQKFEQLQLSVQPLAPLPLLLTPESAAVLQTHPYLPDGDRLYANLLQTIGNCRRRVCRIAAVLRRACGSHHRRQPISGW